MSAETKLRTYILENYLFTKDSSALNNSDSFLTKGIVDSTGMLEIIHFLQDEFHIHVEDAEMIPENLDSVNNLVAFVNKKTPRPT